MRYVERARAPPGPHHLLALRQQPHDGGAAATLSTSGTQSAAGPVTSGTPAVNEDGPQRGGRGRLELARRDAPGPVVREAVGQRQVDGGIVEGVGEAADPGHDGGRDDQRS